MGLVHEPEHGPGVALYVPLLAGGLPQIGERRLHIDAGLAVDLGREIQHDDGAVEREIGNEIGLAVEQLGHVPAQQHVGHHAVGGEDGAARVVRHVRELAQEILRCQLEIALLALAALILAGLRLLDELVAQRFLLPPLVVHFRMRPRGRADDLVQHLHGDFAARRDADLDAVTQDLPQATVPEFIALQRSPARRAPPPRQWS